MSPPSAPSLLVVAHRELVRTGRRWQTWAIRCGFAGALLVLVVAIWSRIPALEVVDRVALGSTGRQLFRAFVGLQTAGIVLLTPILVTNAVIEERDGGTLQLLALTRLRPGSILWGKVLSRVLLMELVVIGGLPFLALCSSLGGFGPWDLLNVLVQSTTMVLSISAVACFLGLYSPGPFRPAMQCWLWTVGAWWLASLPHAAMRLDPQAFAAVSPTLALFGARGWQVLGPPLAQLPASAAVLALSAAGLRAMLAGADDERAGFGSLSQDFAGLRTARRSLGWTAVAIVGAVPLLLFQKPMSAWFAPLGHLSVPWTAAWIWLGTGAYLLTVRWLLLRRDAKARRTPLKRWSTLAEEWAAEGSAPPPGWRPLAAGDPSPPRSPSPSSPSAAGGAEAAAWAAAPSSPREASPPRPVAAQVGGLSGRSPRPSERITRSRRWFFGEEVWADPVLWRETMTSAWGGLGGSVLRLYIAFLVLCLGLLALGGFRHAELALTATACALTFAVAITLLTASASIAGEIQRGTLPTLLATRLSAARILRSKLLATGLFVAPAWLGAVVFGLQGVSVLVVEATAHERGLLALRWLVLSAWSLVLLIALAVSCHAIGLRARTSTRVWIGTVLWAAWNLVGPLVLLFLVEGADAGELLVGVWNPLLSETTWDVSDAPWALVGSTVAWAVAAVGLFVANVRTMRRG